jgi:hypothetical protein
MASCCCEEEEDEEEEEEEAAFGSSNFGNSGNCGKSIVPNGVSILFDDDDDDEGASVSTAFNRKLDALFKPLVTPISKAFALARVVVVVVNGLLLFHEGAAVVFFAHF